MDTAAELRQAQAHAAAGHTAIAIIKDFGLDIGGAMLAGYARAFVLAHAAVMGWQATDQLLAELAAKRPHPTGSQKAKLRIVNQ